MKSHLLRRSRKWQLTRFPMYCRTVRLTGATFFDIVATAPWVAEQPPREMILPKILPGAEHLIAYHVVTEGRCLCQHHRRGADRGRSRRSHRLHQRRSACPVEQSGHARRSRRTGALDAAMRGTSCPSSSTMAATGRPTARFVCGYLACDAQPFNPLLDNLPPVIKTGGTQGGDAGLAWPVHPRSDDGIGGETRAAAKACSPS